jgi:hypothetical protein
MLKVPAWRQYAAPSSQSFLPVMVCGGVKEEQEPKSQLYGLWEGSSVGCATESAFPTVPSASRGLLRGGRTTVACGV